MRFCLPALLLIGLTVASRTAGATGPRYYTADEVAAIRARAQDPAYATELAATRKAADLLADLSDEAIWSLVPEAERIRAINVRFGTDCPVHGAEVFKVGGHYPWIMYPVQERAYKLECPIGHELYPTNDFAAHLAGKSDEKLDTTQQYVDDGTGWIDAQGRRFYFVGYYTFWQVWRRQVMDGVEACGRLYLATGDAKYAHKAALCLARVSQVYPKLDWGTQGVSDGKHPSGWTGRINDRIWENGALTQFAVAYDSVRGAIAADEPLRRFAAARGVPDVAAAIERDVLQVGAADVMAKRVHGNKMELGTLSTLALVLGNDDPARGATTRQMVDWLLAGGGELEYTFYNGFDRDGMGGESSPGYSAIWNSRFVQAADNLARLGVDVTSDAKWRRLAKGPAEVSVLDRLQPRLGDTGGGLSGNRHVKDAELLAFAVRHFRDPDAARWLLRQPARTEPAKATTQANPFARAALFARATIPAAELASLAGAATFPASPYTRDLGGYGLAILELDDGAHRRAATLYYGGVENFHCHRDRLNFGYYVGDREVLTEMGYPSHWGPVAEHWVKNTPSHYCVLVDGQAHASKAGGRLTEFADADGLKLAAADALDVWVPAPPLDPKEEKPADAPPAPAPPPPPPPKVSAYHRTLALLDTGERSTLLIDAFHVAGGRQHDYSFHGLPWGRLEHDLKLSRAQERGTLAGEGVDYGQDPGDGSAAAGWQYLMKPRWHTPDEVSHLRWRGDGGLNQDTWFVHSDAPELIIADGVPPLRKENPATIPYVFVRHRDDGPARPGAGGEFTSFFLSVTDVGPGETKVKSVRRLASPSPAAGGAVVEMASGATWRVYVNRAGSRVTFDDGATSDAPFAAVREVGGTPATVKVIGAGTFAAPKAAPVTVPPLRMTVEAVDYAANTVRVAGAPPAGLVGDRGLVVRADTGPNSASYTVRSVDGATLGFGEVGLITGRFRCAFDASRGQLVAQERTSGDHNRFHGRSFAGMTAVNEDRSTTATITAYDRDANAVTLDASPDQAARFADLDGDGRSYVYIADVGPGTVLTATPTRTVTPDDDDSQAQRPQQQQK